MKATLYNSFFRPSSGPPALRPPGSKAKLLAFNEEGCNHFRQGHSKNPSGDSLDGVIAIFAEVLARFGDGVAAFADQTDCSVSQGCQWACSSPNTASVLVQGHVADVMELVFDGPVVADEFKQTFGSSLVWVETGDQIDDFGARFIADPPRSFEAGDLA